MRERINCKLNIKINAVSPIDVVFECYMYVLCSENNPVFNNSVMQRMEPVRSVVLRQY